MKIILKRFPWGICACYMRLYSPESSRASTKYNVDYRELLHFLLTWNQIAMATGYSRNSIKREIPSITSLWDAVLKVRLS